MFLEGFLAERVGFAILDHKTPISTEYLDSLSCCCHAFGL